MFENRIDWNTPPSRRRTQAAVGRRLVFDVGVAAAATAIIWLLVSALLGHEGVNQQGLRAYMIDVMPGARYLAWGVVVVVFLAMLFVVFDAVRVLLALLREQHHD